MQFKTKQPAKLIPFNLFIFFVAIYLLTASGPNFYDTDSSQLRIEVVKSILEKGDVSVPESIGLIGIDGKSYSFAGIGSALLAVPFYIVGKYVGSPEKTVSIMNHIIGAGTVVLVFLFSIILGYSERASLCVAIFYGLGTIAWPLAKQPFDHSPETFFLLLSVFFIYLYVLNKKYLHLLLSAFSIGVAFITRQTSILAIPPLFILLIVYYIKRYSFKMTVKLVSRDLVLFSLIFVPFISLILWYNYYRFGSILVTGYQLIAARTRIDFFTGTPFLTGLNGLLASPGKGFFYYSPIATLFFFSIKPFIKKHIEIAICFICMMLSYLLFFSRLLYWHGDWAWGPRFMLAITPFFIIPIAQIIDIDMWLKTKFLRSIIYVLFAVSLIIQITAVTVDFHKYFSYLQIEKKVQFIRAEPPNEIYFDWHKSPILAQFKFIYEMSKTMKDYRHSEYLEDAHLKEEIKLDPSMYFFDFWFVYKYYLDGERSILIAPLILILIAIYAAARIWKTVSQNYCHLF